LDTTTSIFLIISVIIQIIVFITVILLVVSLIKIIKSLSVRIDSLQKDFDDFKVKIEPGIEDSIVLIKKVNRIADVVENNIHKVEEVTDKFKNFSEEIVDFGSRIKERIEPPVLDTIITISAVYKGLKVFFDKLKNQNRTKSQEENFLFDKSVKNDEPQSEEKKDTKEEEIEDINKELNEVRKKLEEMKKV